MSIIISGALVAYGSLYLAGADDGVTTQTWNTTPAKIVAWSAEGPAQNLNVDLANNQITIISAGIYQFNFHIAFTTGGAGEFEIDLFVNGVKDTVAGTDRRVAGAGGPGSMSLPVQRSLDAGDIVTMFGESDVGGGVLITFNHMQFTMHRIA